MSEIEETTADFETTSVTVGKHPMEYFRRALQEKGIVTAADLGKLKGNQTVKTAGSIIVRQRPSTAKGLLFITLEDETGMSQAMVTPQLLHENRETILGSSGLIVEGILQERDGSVSVRAQKLWPLDDLSRVPSHDFR